MGPSSLEATSERGDEGLDDLQPDPPCLAYPTSGIWVVCPTAPLKEGDGPGLGFGVVVGEVDKERS